MATELSMNGRKKIETIQKEFTSKFPYLTLVFLDEKRQTIDISKSLSEVRKVKGDDVSIIASLKVNTLEKRFLDNFGIIVEVAYQKQEKLIFTKDNVNLTLNELNKWCSEHSYDKFQFSKTLKGNTLMSIQDQLLQAIKGTYPLAEAKKINKDNFLDIFIPETNTNRGSHLFFNTSKGEIKVGFYCRDEEFIKKVLSNSSNIEKYSQGIRILNNPIQSNVDDAAKNALSFIDEIINSFKALSNSVNSFETNVDADESVEIDLKEDIGTNFRKSYADDEELAESISSYLEDFSQKGRIVVLEITEKDLIKSTEDHDLFSGELFSMIGVVDLKSWQALSKLIGKVESDWVKDEYKEEDPMSITLLYCNGNYVYAYSVPKDDESINIEKVDDESEIKSDYTNEEIDIASLFPDLDFGEEILAKIGEYEFKDNNTASESEKEESIPLINFSIPKTIENENDEVTQNLFFKYFSNWICKSYIYGGVTLQAQIPNTIDNLLYACPRFSKDHIAHICEEIKEKKIIPILSYSPDPQKSEIKRLWWLSPLVVHNGKVSWLGINKQGLWLPDPEDDNACEFYLSWDQITKIEYLPSVERTSNGDEVARLFIEIDDELELIFDEFVSVENGSYLLVIYQIYTVREATIIASKGLDEWLEGTGGEDFRWVAAPQELLKNCDGDDFWGQATKDDTIENNKGEKNNSNNSSNLFNDFFENLILNFPSVELKEIKENDFVHIYMPDLYLNKAKSHFYFKIKNNKIEIGFYVLDKEFINNLLQYSEKIEVYKNDLRLKENPIFENDFPDAFDAAMTFIWEVQKCIASSLEIEDEDFLITKGIYDLSKFDIKEEDIINKLSQKIKIENVIPQLLFINKAFEEVNSEIKSNHQAYFFTSDVLISDQELQGFLYVNMDGFYSNCLEDEVKFILSWDNIIDFELVEGNDGVEIEIEVEGGELTIKQENSKSLKILYSFYKNVWKKVADRFKNEPMISWNEVADMNILGKNFESFDDYIYWASDDTIINNYQKIESNNLEMQHNTTIYFAVTFAIDDDLNPSILKLLEIKKFILETTNIYEFEFLIDNKVVRGEEIETHFDLFIQFLKLNLKITKEENVIIDFGSYKCNHIPDLEAGEIEFEKSFILAEQEIILIVNINTFYASELQKLTNQNLGIFACMNDIEGDYYEFEF